MTTYLWILILIAASTPVVESSLWSCDAGDSPFNEWISAEGITDIETGPLSRFGFGLYISGNLVDPDKHITLQTGLDYVVRIKVTDDRLRGAFFKLVAPNGVDTVDALQPRDDKMRREESCVPPDIGIGTVDLRPKPGATGVLRLNEEASVTLEATVIKTVTNTHVTYLFSKYNIKFVDDMPPISSPTKAPTDRPVQEPTSSGFCAVNRVQQCQTQSLTSGERDECNTCIGEAISVPTASCSQLEAVICTALTDCACGSCQAPLETYLSCAYQTLLGCNLKCMASATSTVQDEFTFTS